MGDITDTSSFSASGSTAGEGTVDPLGSKLVRAYEKLKHERVNWEQVWQEALEQTMPQSAFITKRRNVEGERIDERIFDSTPKRANQVLAAGFHGNLTNPSTRWFRLRLQDQALNDFPEVRVWLSDAERKILNVLNASNFNQQIHQAYLDLGSIGTSIMFEQEDPIEIVRFQTIQAIEGVIDEDHRGRVDTFMRKYTLSARQAFQRWGESAGKATLEAMKAEKFNNKIEFLHAVGPRAERDPGKNNSQNMPWASDHVDFKSKRVIDRGGFEEFPFFVTRFSKVSNDKYGYSPGIVMLPDMKMLQAVTKTIIRAAQKIVDPPLMVPHEGFLLPLVTVPGGLNWRIQGQAGDDIKPLETKGNIPVGRDIQNDIRSQITQGFFNDLFATLADRRNMTATEVTERITEKMLLLGPTLGRLQSEMLDPIIDRTFAILLRRGILADAPEILFDRQILVEYVSPLALAQRREEVAGINNLLALVAGMQPFKPDVVDKINADEVIDVAGDVFGVQPSVIVDDEAVAEIREQRALQQAAAQAAEALTLSADVTKTESETAKNLAVAQ